MRHWFFLLLTLVAALAPGDASSTVVSVSGVPVFTARADTLGEDETRSTYERQMSWFSRDKAYHFSISAVGAGGVYAIGRELGLSRLQASLASAVVIGTVGVWREIGTTNRGNLFTRAHISRKDLVWDGVGIAVGISLADLLHRGPRSPE